MTSDQSSLRESGDSPLDTDERRSSDDADAMEPIPTPDAAEEIDLEDVLSAFYAD
ncbi:hypothetical protein [Halorussus pelagicus]|uniref:hypothetical protein n=1 Tax=Halorussus pelagicus TaxID=2505977 RepID=UPI00140CAC43|nr:hypothetical protein [Halorussus pelagicus]